MKTATIYFPNVRTVGSRFRPVVRVFEGGKPQGSKCYAETFGTAFEARMAAFIWAAHTALKTGARVITPKAVAV